MREIAIDVRNLHVNYRIMKRQSIKTLLLNRGKNKPQFFNALKDVSFSLEKGTIMGIVGKNGSGKSTLLNTIAGIFSPDSGTVDLHGNSISLLSIGVGFQKNLSGRDNIILCGMMLGFSKQEVMDKMEEIIEFSELGSFIDSPIKTYSSGMYSKLAFSITAILETDIMLIDEVLSVGDARFKKKSYAKMKELISDSNRTVLIVSHSNETLERLCDCLMWLHEGEVKMFGDTKKVLAAYNEYSSM